MRKNRQMRRMKEKIVNGLPLDTGRKIPYPETGKENEIARKGQNPSDWKPGTTNK